MVVFFNLFSEVFAILVPASRAIPLGKHRHYLTTPEAQEEIRSFSSTYSLVNCYYYYYYAVGAARAASKMQVSPLVGPLRSISRPYYGYICRVGGALVQLRGRTRPPQSVRLVGGAEPWRVPLLRLGMLRLQLYGPWETRTPPVTPTSTVLCVDSKLLILFGSKGKAQA